MNKIATFVSGEKYQHMIKPFVNSAKRFYDVHIFCTKEIKLDGLDVTRHTIEFNHSKDKIKNISNKPYIWCEIIKKIGECILIDVDTVIINELDIPTCDVFFTTDKRWSKNYDYINTGVLYSKSLFFMEDWVELNKTVDFEKGTQKPYLAIDQNSFYNLINFKDNILEYDYKGLKIKGGSCDIYNNYDDKKLIDINKTKVLHYKNRWQEGRPNPSKNRMDIIKKFL